MDIEKIDALIAAIPHICKQVRKERDMTQRDLADYIGVKQATVSRWELGLSAPDTLSLCKLINLARPHQ